MKSRHILWENQVSRVAMPHYTLTCVLPDTPELLVDDGQRVVQEEFEGISWLAGLGRALLLFGIDETSISRVSVDVTDEHTVRVVDPVSHGVVLIQEADVGAPQKPEAPLNLERPGGVLAEGGIDLDGFRLAMAGLGEAATKGAVCEQGLDVVMQHLAIESSSVLLHDPEREVLWFAAIRGPKALDLMGLSMSDDLGIAGFVFRSGTGMLVRDARKDPRHYAEFDAQLDYETRDLLALPLRKDGITYGVLELMNPLDGTGFTDRDHAIAGEFVSLLADYLCVLP